MKIVPIDSLNYTIITPSYTQLLALGKEFFLEKGISIDDPPFIDPVPDNEVPLEFFKFIMKLFKAGESEEYKGIVNDFLTLLALLGIDYQPIMVVEKKEVKCP